MTSEEIKQTVSMTDVLARYGLKPDRHHMLSCPFHGADKHASMKIYKDGYHCFTCGAHGDIFGFVMEYERVDFKGAFVALGGTYAHGEEERRKASISVKRRQLQAQTDKLKAERLERRKKENNAAITGYRILLEKAEPLSYEYARLTFHLQMLLEEHRELNDYDIQ